MKGWIISYHDRKEKKSSKSCPIITYHIKPCHQPVEHDIVHDADCWCCDAPLYEVAYVPFSCICRTCYVAVVCVCVSVYVCVCVRVCVCSVCVCVSVYVCVCVCMCV